MSSKKSAFHMAATCGVNPEVGRLYRHYENLALNLYRWENLPDSIESRNIEKALYDHGQAVFTDDENYGLIVLPSTSRDNLNIYGDPTAYVLTGVGYSKTIKVDDGVRILNNDTAIPTRLHIYHFADRIGEIESVIRQNLRQQRMPFIIATNKRNEYSMKALMDKVLDGEEAIFLDESLTKEGELGVHILNTSVPFLVDKLRIEQHELEVQLLTFLGLNSAKEKRERLLTDEVNANNTIIQMNADLGLKTRRLACEKINAKYGLNISVDLVVPELEPLFNTSLEMKGEKVNGLLTE